MKLLSSTAVATIYGFLMLAPLIVVYTSFSPGVLLELPPRGFTLGWYQHLMDEPRLLNGIQTSFWVATLATALALLGGVPAAYALTRCRLPARSALATFFLSPLNLPGLVLAVGVLMVLTSMVQPLVSAPLTGTLIPLVGVHVLVTLPWVIRTVSANLEISDPHLEEAARGLGASPSATFFLVTIPSIWPGLTAGAIFAFIVSFGNFSLSLFFSSGTVTTLPVAIFEYIDQYQDPTVAAASSLVILVTALLVLTSDRIARSAAATRHQNGRR